MFMYTAKAIRMLVKKKDWTDIEPITSEQYWFGALTTELSHQLEAGHLLSS